MDAPKGFKEVFFENSDVEEDFRSCCTEDEEWQDTEESLAEGSDEILDEFSLRMFFKGVSHTEDEGVGSKVSGIGVVMERSPGVPIFKVQKKLDFYVEMSVAEHLALMDGLLEALRNGVRRVYAYTDSEEVYDQIAETEDFEDPLLVALGERIMEHADKLEDFVLKLVPSSKLRRPLRLAQEAIGIVSQFPDDELVEECPICCEEKQRLQMIKLNCCHKFCANCMIMYAEGKLQASQVPISCPQLTCKYCISIKELKAFLPPTCNKWLLRAATEADVLNLDRIYCPFPNCSVLLSPSQCLSYRASSSSQSDNCIECPECNRFICISCAVPWHASMSCEEYQNLPEEERDAGDITLHRLAQNNRWRRCQQCRRMIELIQGCYHMTCWCGHEFCYSCGAEYRNGTQTCQCAFWDDDNVETSVASSNQDSEQWRWDSFDCLPAVIDAYSEQERAQLALMQRFLAGGFGLSDHHHPCQSPPRCADSVVDTIKDLHQLPWLERFVSVISDNYHEDFIQ